MKTVRKIVAWAFERGFLTPRRLRIFASLAAAFFLLTIYGAYCDFRSEEARRFVNSAGDGDIGTVRAMLAGGISPDVKTRRRFSAIQAATVSGHTEIVRLLLDKGANPEPALRLAANYGHVDILKMLVAKGVKVSGKAGTPFLCEALENSRLDAASYLLQQGADANALDDPFGFPPIFYVSFRGSWALFQTMLDHGARLDVRGRDGSTALMHFSDDSNDNPRICRYLIAHGAQVNAMDNGGQTAPIYVTCNGPRYGDGNDGSYPPARLEMLRYLLHNGANVNA